ncbi:hypothetical protein ON010_g17431 [Phytophthora cinnamomi]|nr:hypothetical protein ON010_g17431 [Phytophthora cinnamomi]
MAENAHKTALAENAQDTIAGMGSTRADTLEAAGSALPNWPRLDSDVNAQHTATGVMGSSGASVIEELDGPGAETGTPGGKFIAETAAARPRRSQPCPQKLDRVILVMMRGVLNGVGNGAVNVGASGLRPAVDLLCLQARQDTRASFPNKQLQDKITTMATDSAFAAAGKAAGLEAWRIEDLQPVAVPAAEQHKLHSGDSYIFLKTSEATTYDTSARPALAAAPHWIRV